MPEHAELSRSRRSPEPAQAHATRSNPAGRHERLEARARSRPSPIGRPPVSAPVQLSAMGKAEKAEYEKNLKAANEEKNEKKPQSAKAPKGGRPNAGTGGAPSPHSREAKRAELLARLDAKRQEEREEDVASFVALISHMGGEGTGTKIKGGHLVSALTANYSTLLVVGTASNSEGWHGGWNDNKSTKWFKEGSFFPLSWTVGTLTEEVKGIDKARGATLRTLKNGLVVEKKGDTFFPANVKKAKIDAASTIVVRQP